MEQEFRKKVIVKYNPRQSTFEELDIMFRGLGPVESIEDAGYQSAKRKFLFVTYTTARFAKRAVRILKSRINGSMLKISFAYSLDTSVKNTVLYVTNLPTDYTEEKLIILFKNSGKMISTKIIYSRAFFANHNIYISKGVACIRFSLHYEAVNAFLALDGVGITTEKSDKIIRTRIRFARPRWMQFKEYTPYFIFVYNLPNSADEEYTKRIFETYGVVETVRNMENESDSKGMVVKMTNSDDAERAVTSLQGLTLDDKKIEVYL